jgi:hypothetical protein
MNRTLVVASWLVVLSLLLPASALAEEGFPLQISAGIKGGINGAAGHGFDSLSQYTVDDTTYEFRPEYYGHFGTGPAAGLSLELRAMDIVGLEFGFYYTSQTVNGYVDKNDGATGERISRINMEQVTSGFQIPILLKLTVPTNVVRPALGLGIELIRQNDASLSYDETQERGTMGASYLAALNENNRPRPVNYTVFQFTLGAEILAGPVRIPIELRGGYALGYDQDIQGRADLDPDEGTLDIDTMYLGHFGIYTGVMYEFDLRL